MRAIAIAGVVLAFAGTAARGDSGSGSPTVIPLDASAPEIKAAASPSALALGGKLTVFVTAAFDPGVEVNLREPVELGGGFEVIRRTATDHAGADGRTVREWQIEAYAWDLGDLMIPPIAVTFTAAGHAGQIETNPVPIRVTGVLGEKDEALRPSAPPIALFHYFDWKWWAWRGGIALLALVVGVLVGRRFRRRRVVQLVTSIGVPIRGARIDLTSERALAQLLAIERSGVLDRDDDRKAGYTDMAEVLREYLGSRFGVAVVDLTTGELLSALAAAAPSDVREQVATWLERCDVVKYGGSRASGDEAHAVLADARALIMTTTPVAIKAAA